VKASEHQRLGLNSGRYLGELPDVVEILRSIESLATACGWTVEWLLPGTDRALLTLHRRAVSTGIGQGPSAPARLYVSAGIHGDEPAGPRALRHMFESDSWPQNAELWLCPCLNPTGCVRGTRENDVGIDLNREYRQPRTLEATAHIEWLRRQPRFDGVITLHEDWESTGFYCYELQPEGSEPLADLVIAAVEPVCPIERAELIDGRPSTAPGIIRPNLDPASRPDWPEAFWLWQRDQAPSLTFEAPSDFPLPVRVDALVAGLRSALSKMAGG